MFIGLMGAALAPSGEQLFTSVGESTFTVPNNVNQISVVLIGGGQGSGGRRTKESNQRNWKPMGLFSRSVALLTLLLGGCTMQPQQRLAPVVMPCMFLCFVEQAASDVLTEATGAAGTVSSTGGDINLATEASLVGAGSKEQRR